MNTKTRLTLAASVIAALAAAAPANATLTPSGSVGGAPTGVILDNLDWLALGSAGGTSSSGITVNFFGNAQAVTGAVGGQYAAPYLSGGNGTGFGSPNQANGADATIYATSGSTGPIRAPQSRSCCRAPTTTSVCCGVRWTPTTRCSSTTART